MRAIEFLTELFEPKQDVSIQWLHPYKDEARAQVTTPKGHKLDISFWEVNPNTVSISFTMDVSDSEDDPSHGYELTQHGEEFAVFNLVITAAKQYLQTHPKTDILFQVKRTEAQREPLYIKIANRIAKQMGFRYGSMEELQAKNPNLYNKFDNRYSKLLWYTKDQQGVTEEQVNELYEPESSFPLDWDDSAGPKERHARAYDREGRYIDVKFVPIMQYDFDDMIEVEFSRNESYDMTGGGDAARVLGTVLQAFREYLKGYRPEIFIFGASGGSRSKVYQNLIKRFATSAGYKQFNISELSPKMQQKLSWIAGQGGGVMMLVKER